MPNRYGRMAQGEFTDSSSRLELFDPQGAGKISPTGDEVLILG